MAFYYKLINFKLFLSFFYNLFSNLDTFSDKEDIPISSAHSFKFLVS